MDQETVDNYLRDFDDVRCDYPFSGGVAVYSVGEQMFAIINEGSEPLKLSLRCDPRLAQTLREKYETVMPGQRLHKKHWNTMLLTGQLSWAEVQDLIRHAYVLVAENG
jgi:predicted DNA-binding protein (MmcQ/YjbR family)